MKTLPRGAGFGWALLVILCLYGGASYAQRRPDPDPLAAAYRHVVPGDVLTNGHYTPLLHFPGGDTLMRVELGLRWPRGRIGMGAVACDTMGRPQYYCRYRISNTGYWLYYPDGDSLPTALPFAQAERRFPFFVPVPEHPEYHLLICADRSRYTLPSGGIRQPAVRLYRLDSRLNGGRGDLDPSLYDVLLHPITTLENPGLAVARHANGRDLWLLCTSGFDRLIAYPITPSGLDAARAVVSVVRPLSDARCSTRTNFRLALDGRSRRLVRFLETGALDRFDFDPASGRVSGQVVYAQNSCPGFTIGGCQAGAIAPRGRYLYWAFRTDSLTNALPWRLRQFDLNAPDSARFWGSARSVLTLTRGYTMQDQNALTRLDGRVYYRPDNFFSTYVVVNRPDLAGLACQATLTSLRDSALVYFYPPIPLLGVATLPRLTSVVAPCPGQVSTFRLTQPGAVDSVVWRWADAPTRRDTGHVVTHAFQQPGTWRVVATYRYGGYGVDSLVTTVTIAPAPPAVLLARPLDSLFCADALAAGVRLRVRADLPAGVRLRWGGPAVTAADTLPGLTVRQPGTYSLTATLGPCQSQDRLTVRVAPALPAALLARPFDSLFCADALAAGVRLRARADLPVGVRLRWGGPAVTAADTLPGLTVRQPGTYSLTATLGPCQSQDSAAVGVGACQAFPNLVTPNADGRNDGLPLPEAGGWTLTVWSRWGQRVWQSAAAGYRAGDWPGGSALPAGTYYYLFERPADGRRYKGWVEVVH